MKLYTLKGEDGYQYLYTSAESNPEYILDWATGFYGIVMISIESVDTIF